MADNTHLIAMLREAKAARDAARHTDPKADDLLARAEAGTYDDPRAKYHVSGPQVARVVADPGHISGKRMVGIRPGRGGDGVSSSRPTDRTNRPTPKMINFIRVLLGQVPADVAAKARPWFEEHESTMTFDQARDVIDRLKGYRDAAPVATRPAAPSSAWATWRDLAAQLVELGGQHGARFAVKSRTGNNDLDFWMIAKWDGPRGTRYYLRRVIGGQPDRDTRMSPEAMVEVARSIATDPREAMLRYGRELGHCGHCGRHLTDETSRAYGKGPVCRAKAGW